MMANKGIVSNQGVQKTLNRVLVNPSLFRWSLLRSTILKQGIRLI